MPNTGPESDCAPPVATTVVAIAVLIDDAKRVLLALRDARQHQGGLWEFPGGKVEGSETAEAALVRELAEELGIRAAAEDLQALTTQVHDYEDKRVELHTFVLHCWQGEPQGMECQPLAWVDAPSLDSYAFPAANGPILKALQAYLGS